MPFVKREDDFLIEKTCDTVSLIPRSPEVAALTFGGAIAVALSKQILSVYPKKKRYLRTLFAMGCKYLNSDISLQSSAHNENHIFTLNNNKTP